MWPFSLWIFIFSGIIYLVYQSGKYWSAKYLFLLLGLKIIFANLIGLYYFYFLNAGGDAFVFFEVSKQILNQDFSQIVEFYLRSDSQINFDTPRSVLFVKIILPFIWLSIENFWLTSSILAALSFLPFIYLILSYQSFFRAKRSVILLSFFLFPSVLVWTSGLYKENFALIFLIFSILPLLDIKIRYKPGLRIFSLLIALIAFYWLFQLRYFIAFTLLAVYAAILLESSKKTFLIASAGFVLFFLAILFIHPVLKPDALPEFLFQAHHDILDVNNPQIDLWYSFDHPNWYAMLKNLPIAFINAFLRPFPWEWSNAGLILYALENYILLFFLFRFLTDYKKHSLSIWLILIILTSSLMFVSLATPNFGSLYRYRSLYLPFFLLIFLYKSLKLKR